MVFEILLGIRENKYTNMKQVMNDFGLSNYLLKTIFQGMVKRGFLLSINCEKCKTAQLCDEDNYCKGFDSYWLLTDKGRFYLNENRSIH